MTNMNIYWNEDYCGSTTNYETLTKSKWICSAIQMHPQLSEWVKVKNPADTTGALSKAQLLLQGGVDPAYLQAVITGRPRVLAETNNFEWEASIYPMVLNSTAGIYCAIRDVRKGYDHACSLSSGLHHATRNSGNGWCTVNSLAIGALYAQKHYKSVVILDLDAHCGGGTNSYIQGTDVKQVDLSMSGFDTYEDNANSTVDLCPNKDEYLSAVATSLQKLTALGPDIVFYNAGVDVFPQITSEMVIQREQMVASRLRTLGVPTVIVMAGGYGAMTDIVPLHLATISAFSAPHLLSSRVAAGQPNAGQFIDPILALSDTSL